MTRTTVSRTINAPVEKVFDTVAHIQNFSKAVPHIVKVEFLSDTQSGVGARFRETRIMNGKEASTELEVTEYVKNDRVRMVADSHGTIWDTVFTIKKVGDQTGLEMVMDAKAKTLMSKMMNPMMKAFIQKAVEKDLDAVKVYCEKSTSV